MSGPARPAAAWTATWPRPSPRCRPAPAWVPGLDAAGNQRALTAFAGHWTGAGWKVTLDRRPGDGYVVVTSPADYALTLALTPDGTRLSLSGVSPCGGPGS